MALIYGIQLNLDFTAERNVFNDSGRVGAVAGLRQSMLVLRYNCFIGAPPMVTQWYAADSLPHVINFSSINGIETDETVYGAWSDVLVIKSEIRQNNDMDASQNHWVKLTEQDVEKPILDKNDDISRHAEVKFLPMLAAPHPDTPSCGD